MVFQLSLIIKILSQWSKWPLFCMQLYVCIQENSQKKSEQNNLPWHNPASGSYWWNLSYRVDWTTQTENDTVQTWCWYYFLWHLQAHLRKTTKAIKTSPYSHLLALPSVEWIQVNFKAGVKFINVLIWVFPTVRHWGRVDQEDSAHHI